MGICRVDQPSLFYEFSLERRLPASHLPHSIDRLADLADLRLELARARRLSTGHARAHRTHRR
jgi:hypothetical protein